MDLLNYKEAALLLRCAESTLRKKVMHGSVPYVKPLGRRGRVFFIRDDLERLIRQSGNRQEIGRVQNPLHDFRKPY